MATRIMANGQPTYTITENSRLIRRGDGFYDIAPLSTAELLELFDELTDGQAFNAQDRRATFASWQSAVAFRQAASGWSVGFRPCADWQNCPVPFCIEGDVANLKVEALT